MKSLEESKSIVFNVIVTITSVILCLQHVCLFKHYGLFMCICVLCLPICVFVFGCLCMCASMLVSGGWCTVCCFWSVKAYEVLSVKYGLCFLLSKWLHIDLFQLTRISIDSWGLYHPQFLHPPRRNAISRQAPTEVWWPPSLSAWFVWLRTCGDILFAIPMRRVHFAVGPGEHP